MKNNAAVMSVGGSLSCQVGSGSSLVRCPLFGALGKTVSALSPVLIGKK